MTKRIPRSDSATRALKEAESTYAGLDMPLALADMNEVQKTEFYRILSIQPPSQWTNSSLNLAADLAHIHVLVAQLQTELAKGIEPLITSPTGNVRENPIFGALQRLTAIKTSLITKMGLAQSDKRLLLQPSNPVLTEQTKPIVADNVKTGEFQKRLEARRKQESQQ